MVIDWQINGTVILVVGAHLVAVIVFLVRAADRASRAEEAAKAFEAKLKHIDDRVTLAAAALSLFREEVAREYASRETMRELEERVVKAIDRVSDRLDRVLEQPART